MVNLADIILRIIKRAHRSQVSEQSRHSSIHLDIICTISLFKQAVAQFSQSFKQSRQAWMQESNKAYQPLKTAKFSLIAPNDTLASFPLVDYF